MSDRNKPPRYRQQLILPRLATCIGYVERARKTNFTTQQRRFRLSPTKRASSFFKPRLLETRLATMSSSAHDPERRRERGRSCRAAGRALLSKSMSPENTKGVQKVDRLHATTDGAPGGSNCHLAHQRRKLCCTASVAGTGGTSPSPRLWGPAGPAGTNARAFLQRKSIMM